MFRGSLFFQITSMCRRITSLCFQIISMFRRAAIFSDGLDLFGRVAVFQRHRHYTVFIIKLIITKIKLESVNQARIFKYRVTLKRDKRDTLVFYVFVLLQVNDAVNGTAILILYEDNKGTKGWYL